MWDESSSLSLATNISALKKYFAGALTWLCAKDGGGRQNGALPCIFVWMAIAIASLAGRTFFDFVVDVCKFPAVAQDCYGEKTSSDAR